MDLGQKHKYAPIARPTRLAQHYLSTTSYPQHPIHNILSTTSYPHVLHIGTLPLTSTISYHNVLYISYMHLFCHFGYAVQHTTHHKQHWLGCKTTEIHRSPSRSRRERGKSGAILQKPINTSQTSAGLSSRTTISSTTSSTTRVAAGHTALPPAVLYIHHKKQSCC